MIEIARSVLSVQINWISSINRILAFYGESIGIHPPSVQIHLIESTDESNQPSQLQIEIKADQKWNSGN